MITGEMITGSVLTLLPETLLIVAACALLIIGVLHKGAAFPFISKLSAFFMLVLAVYIGWLGIDAEADIAFGGMVIRDGFSNFVAILILVGAAASTMMAQSDFQGRTLARFEYPILIMLATVGMLLMITSNDLLTLYIGIEMQSLALYVMAAFDRNTQKSPEAGMKYFILGAISSGFLLYGSSLIYGYAGSTQFALIGQSLVADQVVPVGLIIGLVFLLAGLAFKISAVPFHMWTPDVYQGAPMAVTALFAIVPKLAALALIIRIVHGPFAPVWFDAQQILIALSLASMFIGAIGALIQDNLKRLLAYSAITNMGIAMIGVIAGGAIGVAGTLTYLSLYTVMGIGIFACILGLRKEGLAVQSMDDLAGLIRSHPMMAYMLAGFLFSLSGIPPLAGFFGKLAVFQSAIAQDMIWLAVLGVVASVIAAAYYLRVIKVMLFDTPVGEAVTLAPMGLAHKVMIALSAAIIALFVLNPQLLFTLTETAAATLFG